MLSSSELLVLAQWSGYVALGVIALTILAFVLQWGIRFRLVGVSGFLLVLVAGSFGLSLGIYERVDIPNALPYSVVYDTGGTRVAIKLTETAETEFNPETVAATLQEAALNLFSSGRYGQQGETKITIQARIITHPVEGVSEPVYLGYAQRSLLSRNDDTIDVVVKQSELARLHKILQNDDTLQNHAETSPESEKSLV
jgi:hypothetical protein